MLVYLKWNSSFRVQHMLQLRSLLAYISLFGNGQPMTIDVSQYQSISVNRLAMKIDGETMI